MADLWTIGHSTRASEQLVEMLSSFQIKVLADVRRFPHSRRHPQFNTDELKKTLFRAGIRYEYLGDELGGFRHARPGTANVGLKDDSFRGYADHMESPIFAKGVRKLLQWGEQERVAYMCSESNYKACHRRLLSDHLVLLHGATVHHIADVGKALAHEPNHSARLVEGKLVYARKSLDEFARPSA
jgi:uncharacterized protein (DUF488 family)